MAHTPGPWAVQEVKGSFQVPFHVLAADKKPVAWCEGQQLKPDRTSIGEARDNARLIAAAPELLACLQSLRIVFANLEGWRDMDATLVDQFISSDGLHRVDAAIAKATGKESG